VRELRTLRDGHLRELPDARVACGGHVSSVASIRDQIACAQLFLSIENDCADLATTEKRHGSSLIFVSILQGKSHENEVHQSCFRSRVVACFRQRHGSGCVLQRPWLLHRLAVLPVRLTAA